MVKGSDLILELHLVPWFFSWGDENQRDLFTFQRLHLILITIYQLGVNTCFETMAPEIELDSLNCASLFLLLN